MGLCPTMEPSTPFVQRPSSACRINQLPARKNWLDQEEHVRFNAYCDERGYKKSTLVARLIRDHLNSEDFRRQPPLPLDFRTAERKS